MEVTQEEFLRDARQRPSHSRRGTIRLMEENEEFVKELVAKLNNTTSRMEKNRIRAIIEGRKRLLRDLDGSL